MKRQLDEKRKSELSRISYECHLDEHIIPLEELCARLQTDLNEVGLQLSHSYKATELI